MKQISEETVEKTWQEIADFDEKRISKEMSRIGETQPHLLGYFVTMLDEYDQEVKETGIFLFFNIYLMFENASSKEIPKISADDLIATHGKMESLMEKLGHTHEKFFNRIAQNQLASQPFVIEYVTEALFEDTGEQEEAGLDLSDEEIGWVFMLLKTAIDALDTATD